MKRRDGLSKERRSWNMSRIRGKNTSPEMAVRRLLHGMGYRFRLHVRIPVTDGGRLNHGEHGAKHRGKATKARIQKSKHPAIHSSSTPFRSPRSTFRVRSVCPDIVLPKYKTVIFVHGCFWHRHCRSVLRPTAIFFEHFGRHRVLKFPNHSDGLFTFVTDDSCGT